MWLALRGAEDYYRGDTRAFHLERPFFACPHTGQTLEKNPMLPPPITVSSLDVSRLEPLLEDLADKAGARLEEELLRATVVAPAAMPADVVTMNSRVRCQEVLSGREWAVTLVYPRDAGKPGSVSVLAPVGAALLGLSVGQTIDWPGPNGRTLRLSILEIEYQPEAAGDFDL